MKAPAGYLLDTNILSETRRKHPDANVIAFLNEADSSSLYVSVLTLGELRKGAANKRHSDAVGAAALTLWIDGLEAIFADRVLPVDKQVARLWGTWSAERLRPVIDTLLAATAAAHELTLVTRNVGDVQDLSVPLFNPFSNQ